MESSSNLNKTILYYTCNRENESFESKIMSNILTKSGGLPIVSVSQKPIKFGKNICVGDVGMSYFNEFRQILIGAKEVKTEYIVFAEADFLYPEEYFNYNPSGDSNIYRYDNIWMVFIHGLYTRKNFSNGAQIAKRDYIVSLLESYFANQPQWADRSYKIVDGNGKPKLDYLGSEFEYFHGGVACISFRTMEGMTSKSYYKRHGGIRTLPYWGNVYDLRKEYLCHPSI